MISTRLLRIWPVLFAVFLSAAFAQTDEAWGQERKHGRYSGQVVSVIRQISREYRVPLIVELSDQDTKTVELQGGNNSALQLFESIAKAGNGYDFIIERGIGIMRDQKLLNSPDSILNLQFESYRMPRTLGLLQALLPPQVESLAKKRPFEGGILGGSTPELEKLTLERGHMDDPSVKTILVEAAHQRPVFNIFLLYENLNSLESKKPKPSWSWELIAKRPAIEK
jgi:hypothetical protein